MVCSTCGKVITENDDYTYCAACDTPIHGDCCENPQEINHEHICGPCYETGSR